MQIKAYQPHEEPPHVGRNTSSEQIEALILTLIAYRDYGTSDEKIKQMLVGGAHIYKYSDAERQKFGYFSPEYLETIENPEYLGENFAALVAARERLMAAGFVKVAPYKPHSGDLTRKLYVLTPAGQRRSDAIYGGKVETEEKTPEMVAAAAPKVVKKPTVLRKGVTKTKTSGLRRAVSAAKATRANKDGSKRKISAGRKTGKRVPRA